MSNAQASSFILPSENFELGISEHLVYLPKMAGERNADFVYQSYIDQRQTQQPILGLDDAPKYSTDIEWFVLSLENNLRRDIDLLLDYRQEPIRELELYVYSQDQQIKAYQTGDKYPFVSRPVASPNYRLPFVMLDQVPLTLLIGIQGRPPTFSRSLYLLSSASLFDKDDIERRWDWLEFGAIFIIIIYSLVVFLFTRDRDFGLFLCWLLSLMGFMLSNSGYAEQFLWPNNSWWSNRTNNLFIAASNISLTLFAISYMQLTHRFLKTVRVLKLFIGLIIFVELSALLVSQHYRLELAIALGLLCIMSNALLLMTVVKLWREKENEARIFLYAASIYLLALLFNIVRLIVSGWHANPYWWGHLSIIFPVLVLSFALGKRVSRLQLEKKRAVYENRAKSEFLATMSHEIRTPMNGVLGMAELMADTKLNDQQKHYNDMIRQSGETLLQVINDILDLSKIESGRLSLEVIPVHLGELLAEVGYIFQYRVVEGKHVFLCELDETLPPVVDIDPVRLKQILINLLSNAFKFTDQGEVVLSVRNDTGKMVFSVKDSGIGIPANKQGNIFESFTQADSSTTRRFGGSGLGLSICRLLVENMGGEIGIESECGVGSTFWFSIPLSANESSELSNTVTSTDTYLSNKRILLVDDNDTSREILHRWVDRSKLIADIFDSPESALNEVKRSTESGKLYDIFSLDMHMPNINGLELTKKIRSISEYKNTPIVLLTASGLIPLKEELEEYGVTKAAQIPLLCQDLLSIYKEVLSDNLMADVIPGEEAGAFTDELNILVAEDNAVNVMVIRGLLIKMGHNVDVVQNGQEAVECLRDKPQYYDLILMDCEMPMLDGYQATEIIRKELLNDIPIVALTAHALQVHHDRCYQAGMNEVVTKPVSGKRVQAAIIAVMDSVS